MIHSNSRLCYAQWTRARLKPFEGGTRPLPDEPGAEVKMWRLDIRPAADRGFRIVDLGPKAREILGRSPIGTPFSWLFHVGERPEMERLARGALVDRTGLVASLAGIDDESVRVPLEMILLPSHPGDPPALVGCLSPLDPREGAARERPIGLLRLVSFRVPLVPEASAPQPSRALRLRAGDLGAAVE